MANPEHLEILKRGVEVWNFWRAEHPEIAPALAGANLRAADLREADLSRAWYLTQQRVNKARGNEDTKLPEGLEMPSHWLTESETDPDDRTR